MKSPGTLIWTKHAIDRLGERLGSKSDKIKRAVEQMIVDGEFTELPDQHPAPGKFVVRLNVRENPVSLVLQLTPHETIVVTVLPKFINKRSRRSWGRH